MFKRYQYIKGLTSLIGSKDKYFINYLGEVRNELGQRLPTTKDADGHEVVVVESWNGLGDYRVIDLVAIHFKGFATGFTDYNSVIAFVIDGDKSNVQARNVGYRFVGGRLEVARHPGFYYIPGFVKYAINDAGVVISLRDGCVMADQRTLPNPKKNIVGGYVYVRASLWPGKTTILLRHRAMCLVFKEYPNNVDSMVVNHIDGIPGNDWLDNLEWTTRGQNNLHAYVTDLKNQHMRVLVRNVLSGEVTEYYSISECARQLGFPTDETIRQRLVSSEFGTVFKDGTQVKLKVDERDWIVPDDPEKAVRDAQQNLPIDVRNCTTLEVVRYPSIMQAAAATGCNNASIKWRIHHGKMGPFYGYQFKLADDATEWVEFTPKELSDSLSPRIKKVKARHLITGETKEFPSIAYVLKHYGNVPTHQLEQGKQYIFPSGWQMALDSQEFETPDDVDEAIYRSNTDVYAKNESTDEVIIATSVLQMAKTLKLDPKALKKAALTRGRKLYHGWRFKLGPTSPWLTE